MYSAFNQLVLLILCSHRFFDERAMRSLEKWHLKIAIIKDLRAAKTAASAPPLTETPSWIGDNSCDTAWNGVATHLNR